MFFFCPHIMWRFLVFPVPPSFLSSPDVFFFSLSLCVSVFFRLWPFPPSSLLHRCILLHCFVFIFRFVSVFLQLWPRASPEFFFFMIAHTFAQPPFPKTPFPGPSLPWTTLLPDHPSLHPRSPRHPSLDPVARAAFRWTALHRLLSSWFFFKLSFCLLVESWWCLKDMDHPKCALGLSRAMCETPNPRRRKNKTHSFEPSRWPAPPWTAPPRDSHAGPPLCGPTIPGARPWTASPLTATHPSLDPRGPSHDPQGMTPGRRQDDPETQEMTTKWSNLLLTNPDHLPCGSRSLRFGEWWVTSFPPLLLHLSKRCCLLGPVFS